jgi:hypothetical protein
MSAFQRRLAAALAVSALVGAGIGAVVGSAAPPAPGDAGGRAAALASAPAGAAGGYSAATARAAAARGGAAVPLPAGGTFNGVRWELAGGTFAQGEIDGVLEYNAACQWLRAWRDGRDAATALRVLRTAPSWPAMRGTESGAYLGKVASEAAAGGGETTVALLAECDASHQREVQHATERGLNASR